MRPRGREREGCVVEKRGGGGSNVSPKQNHKRQIAGSHTELNQISQTYNDM